MQDLKKRTLPIEFLMLGLIFPSVTFASLANPSEWLLGLLSAATIGYLSVATLATLLIAPPARTSWIGRAVFGWIYFALILRLPIDDLARTNPPLPTTLVADLVRDHLINTPYVIPGHISGEPFDEPYSMPVYAQGMSRPDRLRRWSIHLLGVVIFSSIGAAIARSFVRSRSGNELAKVADDSVETQP